MAADPPHLLAGPVRRPNARRRLADWIAYTKSMLKHSKLLPVLLRHKARRKLQHTSEEPCASSSQDSASLDMACIPDLIGKSDLLSTEIRSCLCMVLPARVEGHPWSLIFNTAEHGFSLKSLYRKALAFECPMLLVVHDSNDKIFGALSTDPIRMKPYYYGTGESFLFTFHQQFRVFRWSGENAYFARGHLDGLQFGSGEGRSGLHLDEGLYHGYTESCLTYRNRPLTSTRNFTIQAVELWALS